MRSAPVSRNPVIALIWLPARVSTNIPLACAIGAFGVYVRDPHAPIAHATGIIVLTLAGGQISAMTGFLDTGALRIFGLPRILPD